MSWASDSDLFVMNGPSGNGAGFYPSYSNITRSPYSWGTAVVKMQIANPAGTVILRSKDPRITPAINFNYFTENRDTDLKALAEATELLYRTYDSAGVNHEVIHPDPTGDMKQGIMDTSFGHHASSSCRMGSDNATVPEAVVDSKFRVKEVKSLRIADASVWPRVPGAMPDGPTFTLGRKVYETILIE